MPQERKKRRLYDDDPGLLRAYSATSWFIDRLGTPLDWCIPQEKKRVFPASHAWLPKDNVRFCLGPSGLGPKRQRTAMEALRAWASEWPAEEPIPSTLDLGGCSSGAIVLQPPKRRHECSQARDCKVVSFLGVCVCASLDSNSWILTYVDSFLATEGSMIVLVNGSLDRAWQGQMLIREAFHASWILRKENSWLQAGGLMTDGNCRELNISKVLFSLYTSNVINRNYIIYFYICVCMVHNTYFFLSRDKDMHNICTRSICSKHRIQIFSMRRTNPISDVPWCSFVARSSCRTSLARLTATPFFEGARKSAQHSCVSARSTSWRIMPSLLHSKLGTGHVCLQDCSVTDRPARYREWHLDLLQGNLSS